MRLILKGVTSQQAQKFIIKAYLANAPIIERHRILKALNRDGKSLQWVLHTLRNGGFYWQRHWVVNTLTPEKIEKISALWTKEHIMTPPLNSFTKREAAAITNYKTPLHEAMNNFLEYGFDFDKYPNPDASINFYNPIVKNIDKTTIRQAVLSGIADSYASHLRRAISKSKLKAPTTVYRGIVASDKTIQRWYQLQQNDKHDVFKRFTSTTLIKSSAQKWATTQSKRPRFGDGTFHPVLMECELPKKMHVLDYPVTGKAIVGNKLDSLKLGPGKGGIDNEAELLLDCYTRYSVIAIRKTRGDWYYVKISLGGDNS